MPEPNGRPPLAVAIEWAHKILAIALEMCLPALAGWWIDERMATQPWALIVGSVFGFVAGFYHLIRTVTPPTRKQ